MIRMDYSYQPRRDILCIDVKSFFASVESVKRRIHPLESYIVVMSNPDLEGGLVLAASPKVKEEYGIRTGSRRFEIPVHSKIEIVEPRMALYIKVNLMINNLFKEFVAEEDIHIYSIDESFLDVTRSHALYGSTEEIAKQIQKTIFQRLRLVTSIGIGDNPLLAKLALDNEAKRTQSQIAIWHYEDVPEKLWKIHPITNMWGIGGNTAKNLYRLGIDSVYSLSQYDVDALKRVHGVIGEQLFYHAHGIDHSVLSEKYTPHSKGYGKSQILKRDYVNQYEIEVVIREMADEVAARLRKHHAETGVIHLSVSYSKDVLDKGFSRQMKIFPTSSNVKIIETCLQIFRTHYNNQPVRQLAIRCGKIAYKKQLQLNLFETPEKTIHTEELEVVIDRIREKYGFSSLVHASSLTKGGTAIQRSGLVGGHKG
ncbi:Y-family DNA polymerase [Desemzia sp. FAM 23991]|uniref:Y-family DNA polymerase n=1 Tax=unclassified Desemzia TaxID=2685243 RepID=UPI003888D55D